MWWGQVADMYHSVEYYWEKRSPFYAQIHSPPV
jgi:hypothetical protein